MTGFSFGFVVNDSVSPDVFIPDAVWAQVVAAGRGATPNRLR